MSFVLEDFFSLTSCFAASERPRRLSSYDAAYLELAQRHQLPRASLNQDLRAAAATLGITVLGR